MEAIEAAAVPMEEVEVGPVGEFLIKWGFRDDPRIPEDERIPAMQRIKDSGKAGVIAYALTEGAFWIGSVPFAIAAVTLATGSLPDFASDEGKAAIGADAFIFINFARLIVPARIAFALGLAPWVDENIVKKFGGDEQAEVDKDRPGCYGSRARRAPSPASRAPFPRRQCPQNFTYKTDEGAPCTGFKIR